MIHGIEYFSTVVKLEDLPRLSLPEIAIVGRSNCGKSTLINVLAAKRRLAYASKTPGRTRAINFFKIHGKGFLVDLPGYGFSRAPHSEKKAWADFVGDYLLMRKNLSGLILLLDIRRTITKLDEQFLLWFRQTGIPVHLVLSKADKFSVMQRERSLNQVRNNVTKRLSEFNVLPNLGLVSSLNKTGIESLYGVIDNWF